MKPYSINLYAGLVLVIFGLWGYLSAEDPSFTALIPVIFGIIFLALTPAFRKENKVVAHLVVLMTLVLIIALAAMPLPRVIEQGNTMGIIRMSVMLAVCALALVIYIKSFVDARKAKG